MTFLDEAVLSALRGQATLVVGSGVGFLAKNAAGAAIPSAARLLELMFEELKEPADLRAPLDRVSAHFGHEIGFPRLYELLKTQMHATEVTDASYVNFLKAPWKRIYTTNFDDVVEVADPKRKSHTIPDDLRTVGKGDIIHLNGYVDNIDPVRFDESTNLTTWSYALSQFAGSPLAHFFRTDLRSSRHVIFLGVSLASDLDITRIISDDRIPHDKVLFVVGPDTPKYDLTTLERYGTVLTAGVDELLAVFERLKNSPSAKTATLPVSTFHAFTRDEEQPQKQRLGLRDQLLFGRIDLQHLILSDADKLVGANQRFIGRSQGKDLATAIIKGHADVAIVHGDIGCGKTFLAIEAARQLFDASFDVFWARAGRYDEDEIQSIAQRDTPTAIIFDGYIEHRDAIETTMNVRNKNTAIVVCLRNVVYDLSRESIASLFGDDAFSIEVRPLSKEELASFDGMLLGSGLLGTAATGSTSDRTRRYESHLGSSIFRILVDLVSSDHLREEIEHEIAPVLNDQQVSAAFAAILAGCVLETEFDIDQWDECVGVTAVDRLLKKYQTVTRHFIDSDGYAFISRPSVVGTELLREHLPTALVIQGLLRLYKYALGADFRYGSRRLIETVMRYSRVEPLFRNDDKYRHLMAYYDAMQSYQQTDANSQYWLQKAIAASVHGNLAKPEVLLTTDKLFATAYARVSPSQTRQKMNIDNYYARYMLMRVLHQEDADRAYTMTVDAVTRLMRQVHLDEAKHYPYKAGRTLADIVIKFSANWAPELKAKVAAAIERLIREANKWREKQGYNRDVESLVADCSSVLPLLQHAAR